MRFIILLTAIMTFTGCTSMHLKMHSGYEGPKGKGTLTFDKSYSTGSFPWICGVSAIFWGGGCWAYLMMPMVPQEQKFMDDAKKSLMAKLETDTVTLVEPEIVLESWSKTDEKLEINQ